MYTRHTTLPVHSAYACQLTAPHYNHVQHALNHLGESIRLPVPGLRHLNLILQKPAWIIVDRYLNDYPVAVWTDFDIRHRDNLHEPISCQLKMYHTHARLALEPALEAMRSLLSERLGKTPTEISTITDIHTL